ncbi:MAG: hypothetical protein IVW36_00595 [Dehalococcoidia bacterium]|nr:hypothetical protein [Dehalococcoidia bacterium]
MSPVDLATHWRVPQELAIEIVESSKAAGLVGADAGQQNFERHARVHLTAAGQEQLAQARQRTWYSGALPVALRDFAERARETTRATLARDDVRAALGALAIDEASADALGQAASSADTVAITGAADDEQREIARALGRAMAGEVRLPYAIYAGGAVVRIFDPRHHEAARAGSGEEAALDILRERQEDASPWMAVRRPLVALAGGILESDVRPAFDDDARFYLAPPPLTAFGGIFAVFDADAHTAALGELARLWLVPGRHGAGLLLLRSGERIEVPWHAATVLFGAEVRSLGAAVDRPAYHVDVSALDAASLRVLIARRLVGVEPGADGIDALAGALESGGLATRRGVARAARYLSDRAAYLGVAFDFSSAIADAVASAQDSCGATTPPSRATRRLRRAA